MLLLVGYCLNVKALSREILQHFMTNASQTREASGLGIIASCLFALSTDSGKNNTKILFQTQEERGVCQHTNLGPIHS